MEKDYIIISLKHTNFKNFPTVFTLWGSNYSGYTEDLEKAGRYSRSELENKFKNKSNYRFIDKPVYGFLENELQDSVFVKISDLENMGFKKKTVVMF